MSLCVKWVMILFFIFLTPVLAESQGDDKPEFNCDQETPMTTVDVMECTGYFYAKADKELNEAYKKLVDVHKQEKGDDSDRLTYLRDMQRSWIKFRDAFCDYEASSFAGGSWAPIVYTGCLHTMTEQQTQRLRELLEHEEDK